MQEPNSSTEEDDDENDEETNNQEEVEEINDIYETEKTRKPQTKNRNTKSY